MEGDICESVEECDCDEETEDDICEDVESECGAESEEEGVGFEDVLEGEFGEDTDGIFDGEGGETI